MTNRDTPRRGQSGANPDATASKNIEFHAACYRLSAALTSLRIAVLAADKALAASAVLEGNFTPDKARELHERWSAASLVMHEALEAVAHDCSAMLDATQALFPE